MPYEVEVPFVGPLVGCIKPDTLRFWMKRERVRDGLNQVCVLQLYRHGRDIPLTTRVYDFLSGKFGRIAICDVAGLEPDTAYQYRLGLVSFTDGNRPEEASDFDWTDVRDTLIDGWPSVRSFPYADESDVQFLFGSCNHSKPTRTSHDFFKKMFETVGNPADERKQGDFFLSVGDLVYADMTGPLKNAPPKSPEALEQRYDETLRVDYVRQFFQGLPLIAIYDDHEIANDWSWGKFKNPPKIWKRKILKPAILSAGMEKFSTHFGLLGLNKRVDSLEKAVAYARDNHDIAAGITPNWYSFDYGLHSFFISDVRGYRSKPGADGTMLGGTQLEALEQWIRDGEISGMKFWVSPVPLFPDTRLPGASPDDVWSGFAKERLGILEAIRAAGPAAKRLVVLSGDVHISGIACARFIAPQGEPPFKLYNIISSGLSWRIGLQSINFRRGKALYELNDGKKGRGTAPYVADFVNIEDNLGKDHDIVYPKSYGALSVRKSGDEFLLRTDFHQERFISRKIGKTLRFPCN